MVGNIIYNTNYLLLSEENWKPRFSISMLASIAVHVAFAMLITFSYSEPEIREKKAPPVMDVVLLDENSTNTDESPNDAKTIANKNNTGQMSDAMDNRTRAARSPNLAGKQPQKKPQPTMPKMAQAPVQPKQQTKKEASIIAKNDDSSASLFPIEQAPEEEHKTKPNAVPNIPLANLLPPSAALTELSREFDRERRMKQMLSKEADIGINTKEAKYAPYAQGLVRSLEEQWRPDHSNVTQLTTDERKVLLSVSIANNGELADIKLIQPSPSSTLNDSAIAAVHAAAPFKPLPSSWGL